MATNSLYETVEGRTRYASKLLAHAMGFGLWMRPFFLENYKKSFLKNPHKKYGYLSIILFVIFVILRTICFGQKTPFYTVSVSRGGSNGHTAVQQPSVYNRTFPWQNIP